MASIELRKPAARGGARLWSVTTEGATVTIRSGVEHKPQKSQSHEHENEGSAFMVMEKAVSEKLRDGYALVRDRVSAGSGAIVFACFASGGGGGVVADVSPDGRLALTAGHRGAPTAVWLELIETTTGARRMVFEREHPRQLFLLSASFDHTGDNAIVTVDGETLLLELSTGATRTLAHFGGVDSRTRSRFNSHVLHPKSDRARRRWCVFDAGTVVRVLDERFATVCEIPLDHPTSELRAASISPDGTHIALYRISRGVIYGAADAMHDSTRVIEIRRTTDGALVGSIAVRQDVHDVTFTADNARLIVSWNYGDGPALLDATSGDELALAKRDEHGYAPTLGWDCDGAGATLAVGSSGVALLDASTLEPRSPTLERWYRDSRTRWVRFCDNDRLLGSARPGSLTLHAL
jgi:hypothetical protein